MAWKDIKAVMNVKLLQGEKGGLDLLEEKCVRQVLHLTIWNAHSFLQNIGVVFYFYVNFLMITFFNFTLFNVAESAGTESSAL